MNNPYAAPAADMSAASDAGDTYRPSIFSLNGRIGRIRYLIYGTVAPMLLMAVVGFLMAVYEHAYPWVGMLALIAYIPVLAMAFIASRRRLHDLEQSGWLSLLQLVPVINLALSVYLLFWRGTDGPNRYGRAPGPNPGVMRAGAWIIPAILVVMIAVPAYYYVKYKAKGRAAVEEIERRVAQPEAPPESP